MWPDAASVRNSPVNHSAQQSRELVPTAVSYTLSVLHSDFVHVFTKAGGCSDRPSLPPPDMYGVKV